MNITYYGHSSLGIESKGIQILVDPFISPNPQAAHINIADLQPQFILLTHAHYDHVMDVEQIVKSSGATIIANFEICNFYEAKGFQTHALGFGGSWTFPFGTVKMVHAVHTSTFPDGSNGGNPAGFVIHNGDKTIYIAGDTALTTDMKLIPLFFKLDFAILPIGDNFTMGVDEAIVAAEFVECKRIMGVHYDTAPTITIDHETAQRKFEARDKELILLPIGDSIKI